MKKTIRFTAAAAAVAAALTMASTAFAANRVITITPDTKWVNVSQGETVNFIDTATGQSFVANFNTRLFEVDLATVAPAGVLNGQKIMVYVQANNTPNSNRPE